MPENQIKVLLVEDNSGDAGLIREALAEAGPDLFVMVHVESLTAAFESLCHHVFDVVLLDLSLPQSRGFDTFQRVKNHPVDVPVVILTGLDDSSLAVEAVKDGAQDYLIKGEIGGVLLSRTLRYAIERYQVNAELERRVVERTKALEAANQELEAFSYSVSHDLRAPLRGVEGFARILLEDFASELSVDAQRYLNLIADNAKQMKKLIDDLLAFSRLSRLPLEQQVVDAEDLFRAVIEDIKFGIGDRQIEIRVGALPTCQGDVAVLRQAFYNLISNAVKYTRTSKQAKVEVGYKTNKDEGVYFVKDNGVGFDMQYADRLFGVFQRLHRSSEFEGTGVGLAIVQRIIQRHGGRIWADAKVGRGATFYFTLGNAVVA